MLIDGEQKYGHIVDYGLANPFTGSSPPTGQVDPFEVGIIKIVNKKEMAAGSQLGFGSRTTTLR
jgi:hypothetical protein